MRCIPAVILAFLFVLSGCGGEGGAPSGPATDSSGATGSGSSSTNSDAKPAGNFLNVNTFPLDQVVDGGVGKDGISALTDPPFVDATSSDARYLSDGDLVMGVVINGEVKAYPHNIGWWHEIVNDEVGGQPIVVSFCPLTGTGMVFDGAGRDGSRITTGVSGLLFNNNLIMYDRRDGATLYPQMIFKGVSGPLQGEALRLLPVVETTWGYWRTLYPNTRVISRNAANESYSTYPYTDSNRGGDYRIADEFIMFPLSPEIGETAASEFYKPKEMTLGVRFGETPKAYPFPAMGKESVINDKGGILESCGRV